MNDNRSSIIEAAYWAGFEPSSEELTAEELLEEAEKYLCEYSLTK